MAGTKEGGIKARKAIMERYGENYYRDLGHKGGTTSKGALRGFATNPSLASQAGKRGGYSSKRTSVLQSRENMEKVKNYAEQGFSTQEIADLMDMCPSTIRYYLRRAKLGK